MARYIDADALLERMEVRLKQLRTEYGDHDHYTDGFDEGLVAVEDADTADVAPKSEVASEIFDEISKLCTLHGDSWNPSRIVAHIYFDWLLELKDKYTKGGEG
jgi:hypothetical protein